MEGRTNARGVLSPVPGKTAGETLAKGGKTRKPAGSRKTENQKGERKGDGGGGGGEMWRE